MTLPRSAGWVLTLALLAWLGSSTLRAQVPPGYPPDTLAIFPRLKAARALGQTAPDSAARELRALIRLAQRTHLLRWESRIRYRLGDLLLSQQQQPAALQEAFAILHLARAPADPDPSAEMLGLVLVGDVYVARADMKVAARYHRQAYELALRAGTPKEQGRTGASLGNTLTSDDPVGAAALLQRCVGQLLTAGDTITAVSAMRARSIALQNAGDLAQAETEIRTALRYYQYPALRADLSAEASTRLALADLLTQRGQAREALAITQHVMAFTRQIRNRFLEQSTLSSMAEAARLAGQPALAYTAEHRLRLLTDSVNSDAVAEQIASLSARFNVAQREARIRALTQQRRIDQLAADRTATRARWLAGATGVLLTALLIVGWLYWLLRRSRARLAQSENQARQLNTTQTRLLSIIGHDARGPLLAVEAVGQLIGRQADQPNPAELRTIATELQATTATVRGLLDNLLYWARQQTGQLLNRPEAVPVADLLRTIQRLYAPVATAKGQTLTLTLAPDTPPTAWADPELLATIVRNLVANALKFSPAGDTVRVQAGTTTPTGALLLTVTDTGPGMPPAKLAAVLGARHPAQYATPGTAGERGTGLGLGLCRQFTELLHGELTATSAVGHGTTFRLVIPTTNTAAAAV